MRSASCFTTYLGLLSDLPSIKFYCRGYTYIYVRCCSLVGSCIILRNFCCIVNTQMMSFNVMKLIKSIRGGIGDVDVKREGSDAK